MKQRTFQCNLRETVRTFYLPSVIEAVLKDEHGSTAFIEVSFNVSDLTKETGANSLRMW